MENKQTAVKWLYDQIIIFPKTIDDLAHNARSFKQAKAMEKEQMIGFSVKVLDNTYCDYDGQHILGKPINDIYNETYGK